MILKSDSLEPKKGSFKWKYFDRKITRCDFQRYHIELYQRGNGRKDAKMIRFHVIAAGRSGIRKAVDMTVLFSLCLDKTSGGFNMV
jgi:hypothetical protein